MLLLDLLVDFLAALVDPSDSRRRYSLAFLLGLVALIGAAAAALAYFKH
jgi:hypothetical protein